MKRVHFWVIILFLSHIATSTVASTVVQDGKTAISEPELRALLKNSPSKRCQRG